MHQLFRYTIFPFFLLRHYLIIRIRIESHLKNITLLFSLMSFVRKEIKSIDSPVGTGTPGAREANGPYAFN